jgi:hypothetical protein
MTRIKQIAADVATFAPSSGYMKILQNLEIGREDRQNELLLFMKPELFMVADPACIRSSTALVLEKLADYRAFVHGIAIVGGQFLADKGIMDRHYGFINRLSKQASQVLTADDKARVMNALGLTSLEGIDLLGGHEYMQKYPRETFEELDQFWFSRKSIKIQSGFYLQLYEKNGGQLVLINGFHPGQLYHFTHPDHRIALFLVHSDTAWKILRNEMVGNTYPEKAAPSSIRGSIFTEPPKFGLTQVDISNNGVHLSAGPFEGVFELSNFFGSLYEREKDRMVPLLIRRMIARGVPEEKALKVAQNPQVKVNGKQTDLFSATEDLDTNPAVDLWLNQI